MLAVKRQQCQAKIWWKCRTLLYGYSEIHCSCKNTWYYKDIGKDVETRFDTSSFELDRPSTKEKYKKVIGLTKDGLGGKVMKEFVGLGAKHIAIYKATIIMIK